MNVQSLPLLSPPSGQPFQDHFLTITLPPPRALCPRRPQ